MSAYPFLLFLLVDVAKDLSQTRNHGLVLHVYGAGDQVLEASVLWRRDDGYSSERETLTTTRHHIETLYRA